MSTAEHLVLSPTVLVVRTTCSQCGAQRQFGVPSFTSAVLQQLYGIECKRCGTPDHVLELSVERLPCALALEKFLPKRVE